MFHRIAWVAWVSRLKRFLVFLLDLSVVRIARTIARTITTFIFIAWIPFLDHFFGNWFHRRTFIGRKLTLSPIGIDFFNDTFLISAFWVWVRVIWTGTCASNWSLSLAHWRAYTAPILGILWARTAWLRIVGVILIRGILERRPTYWLRFD